MDVQEMSKKGYSVNTLYLKAETELWGISKRGIKRQVLKKNFRIEIWKNCFI